MPNFAFNYMAQRFKNHDLSDIDLSSIKQLISCAEPTFIQDLENFYNVFKETKLKKESFRVCYALAENIFAVSQSSNIQTTMYYGQEYVSCGQTIPGISLIIMKDNQDITTEGNNKFIQTRKGEKFRQDNVDIGNIVIKSDYTPNDNCDFYGYYNTGDLGFMENGHLYVTGRQKDAFNSYGINIYPEFIEHEINKHQDIIDGRIVCFGILNNGTHDIHICAETEKYQDSILKQEITNIIQKQFNVSCTVHLRKRYYIIKTSSGKVSRVATKEKFLNESMIKSYNT